MAADGTDTQIRAINSSSDALPTDLSGQLLCALIQGKHTPAPPVIANYSKGSLYMNKIQHYKSKHHISHLQKQNDPLNIPCIFLVYMIY